MLAAKRSEIDQFLTRDRRLVPDDGNFERMFADLLVKMSNAYAASGSESMEFETVRARFASESHDRRAVFARRHGNSTRFPK